jgi:hypothetical protein
MQPVFKFPLSRNIVYGGEDPPRLDPAVLAAAVVSRMHAFHGAEVLERFGRSAMLQTLHADANRAAVSDPHVEVLVPQASTEGASHVDGLNAPALCHGDGAALQHNRQGAFALDTGTEQDSQQLAFMDVGDVPSQLPELHDSRAESLLSQQTPLPLEDGESPTAAAAGAAQEASADDSGLTAAGSDQPHCTAFDRLQSELEEFGSSCEYGQRVTALIAALETARQAVFAEHSRLTTDLLDARHLFAGEPLLASLMPDAVAARERELHNALRYVDEKAVHVLNGVKRAVLGQHRRRSLPPAATRVLSAFYAQHADENMRAYATEQQKVELARAAGISVLQVSNWLSNRRNRKDASYSDEDAEDQE